MPHRGARDTDKCCADDMGIVVPLGILGTCIARREQVPLGPAEVLRTTVLASTRCYSHSIGVAAEVIHCASSRTASPPMRCACRLALTQLVKIDVRRHLTRIPGSSAGQLLG